VPAKLKVAIALRLVASSKLTGPYGRNATATALQQQRDALNAAVAQSQAALQTQAETFGRSLFAGQVNDGSISNTQYVTNLYEAFL